jgi:lipid-binding SYLF domain-containing protein
MRVESSHKSGAPLRLAAACAFLAAALLAFSPAVRADDDDRDRQGEVDRVAAATTAFGEVMDVPERAIPSAVLTKAEGVAVFPAVKKGGFVVGGQWGRGILSVRGARGTWSSPAFLTLTGGSFGLQIGGQEIDLILVIMDRKGLERLVRNQFKIGVDAGVAAGPVGRDAQAATDIQMRAKILSYSRARGLFAGVTINGGTIKQDRDANRRFYGRSYSTSEIVFERLGGAPPPVSGWREALNRFAAGN